MSVHPCLAQCPLIRPSPCQRAQPALVLQGAAAGGWAGAAAVALPGHHEHPGLKQPQQCHQVLRQQQVPPGDTRRVVSGAEEDPSSFAALGHDSVGVGRGMWLVGRAWGAGSQQLWLDPPHHVPPVPSKAELSWRCGPVTPHGRAPSRSERLHGTSSSLPRPTTSPLVCWGWGRSKGGMEGAELVVGKWGLPIPQLTPCCPHGRRGPIQRRHNRHGRAHPGRSMHRAWRPRHRRHRRVQLWQPAHPR